MELQITKQLLAVAACMSQDETRYNLCGVYFDVAKNDVGVPMLRLVATNGHMLAMIDTDQELELGFKSFTLDGDCIKTMCDWVRGKGRGMAPLLLTESEDRGRETVITQIGTPRSMSARWIDGEFLDYRQVLPKEYQGMNEPIGLNAAYVAIACKLAKDAGGGIEFSEKTKRTTRDTSVLKTVWRFGDGRAGVEMTADVSAGKLTVIIMPMRV